MADHTPQKEWSNNTSRYDNPDANYSFDVDLDKTRVKTLCNAAGSRTRAERLIIPIGQILVSFIRKLGISQDV